MNHIQRIRRQQHAQQKFTVLEREFGEWEADESGKLYEVLGVEVCKRYNHPRFIVIFEHFDKEVIQRILGHSNFTLKRVTGSKHKDMPFEP